MAFSHLPGGRRLGHAPPPPRPFWSVWRHRCGRCRPLVERLLTSPFNGAYRWSPCRLAWDGKENLSANHASCSASNLISSRDAIAASIACHAAVKNPRRSLMVSKLGRFSFPVLLGEHPMKTTETLRTTGITEVLKGFNSIAFSVFISAHYFSGQIADLWIHHGNGFKRLIRR